MSARAAARLESLDFDEIYRYTGGKADWIANLLPSEGQAAHQPRVRDFVREAPTARLDERVASINARLDDENVAVVVDDKDVVLGVVRAQAAAADTDRTVAHVMGSPTTIRPHLTVAAAREYLQHEPVLVTTSDGKLVGVLNGDDVERATGRAG